MTRYLKLPAPQSLYACLMTALIDIHTHRPENAAPGTAIINLPMPLPASPLFRKGYYYSAGIHPWELTETNADDLLVRLESLLRHPQVVALGEAGMDKSADAPMELQTTVFTRQAALAEALCLPLVIHCVKATDELLAMRKALRPRQPWIWHGFRGKPQQTMMLVEKGFYLSFGEHYADAALSCMPDERLLMETDESLLHMEQLLPRAARLRGVTVDTLRRTLHDNARRLFLPKSDF